MFPAWRAALFSFSEEVLCISLAILNERSNNSPTNHQEDEIEDGAPAQRRQRVARILPIVSEVMGQDSGMGLVRGGGLGWSSLSSENWAVSIVQMSAFRVVLLLPCEEDSPSERPGNYS